MSKKNGQFEKGNNIGESTRFKKGNTLSKKYEIEYAASLIAFFENCEELPTIEAWAVKNNIPIRTVNDWKSSENEEIYPRFAAAYAQAKAIQKNKLIQLGLTDQYNVQLVKFLLINNHDMAEKVEQKLEGGKGFNISVDIHEVD